MSSKPILFNTEMVKAILEGRKTQFRIPVNVSSDCTYYASGINKTATSSNFNNFEAIFVLPKDKWKNSLTPKLGYFSSCYKDGDIIFVQEDRMARILLKVTNVRVERLQEAELQDICEEGYPEGYQPFYFTSDLKRELHENKMDDWWINLWNSTAKDGYKYLDNPYVFVYEFERIEKQ